MSVDVDVVTRLRHNLAQLESRIQAACDRAGRKRESITLVAITKYVQAPLIQMLYDLGLAIFGESRPQALWDKAPQLPQAEWHLVGHLQRNKVARTLPLAQLIHSVDNFRLLQTIEEEAKKLNKVQEVLLEMHLSGESTKHGFEPDDCPKLPNLVQGLQHVRITGFMCMAALGSPSNQARATFDRLRHLRDQWTNLFPSPHRLQHLSMGMTHDFEEAIQEGATLLRIGSALFEGLNPEG